MRKAVAAVAVGLLLVAGQAAAAGSNSAVARVGDRVGGRTGDAEQFMSIPISVLLIGGAVIVTAASIVADDGET